MYKIFIQKEIATNTVGLYSLDMAHIGLIKLFQPPDNNHFAIAINACTSLNPLKFFRSMSTISFMDEPREDAERPSIRMENTYQLAPNRNFPSGQVRRVVRDVLEGYLSEERYEPELCRQMTKTLSEVSHCKCFCHCYNLQH